MQQSSLLVFQDHQAQLAASLLNERFSANLARQIALNVEFDLTRPVQKGYNKSKETAQRFLLADYSMFFIVR